MASSPRLRAAAAFAVVAVTSIVATWLSFRPLRAWISYPLAYTLSSDGLVNLWVAKSVRDAGWFGVNWSLGAPFGTSPLDFARPELLFLGFYKLVGLATSNIVFAHNLLYLAGFTLVALAALPVLRWTVQLSWPFAMAGSLAFTWLPYHFDRIEHLFLSVYVAVPLAASLVLRVSSERPPFFERGRVGAGSTAGWIAVVIVGCTSIYYAFFALALLAAEGVLCAIRRRSLRPLASAALVTGAVSATVLLALSPSLWDRAERGANPTAFRRTAAESELYALRPAQLLLPDEQHRVPALARPARLYNSTRSAINENRWAALGLLGSAGFLLLVVHVLTGERLLPASETMAAAARATLVALGVGIVGGAGAFVALFVTPQFRSLNRISVYIAFFSIAAVMAALERVRPRSARWQAAVTGTIAFAVTVLAYADQRPANRPDLGAIARAYDSDAAFVARVEHTLPAGALVFQAPHTRFPEVRPFAAEPFYSPLRMYVHSDRLRWSYGSMKGRREDAWLAGVGRLPAGELMIVLRSSGFSGVVVDRQAVADRGASFEADLAAAGAGGPTDSLDRTLAFYTLPSVPGVDDVPASLVVAPGGGFYPQEGTYPDEWQWTSGNAEAWVHRFGKTPLRVTLSCTLQSLNARRVEIRAADAVVGAVWIERSGRPYAVSTPLELRPGWTRLEFRTDRPGVRPAGGRDTRTLAVFVGALRLRVAEAAK